MDPELRQGINKLAKNVISGRRDDQLLGIGFKKRSKSIKAWRLKKWIRWHNMQLVKSLKTNHKGGENNLAYLPLASENLSLMEQCRKGRKITYSSAIWRGHSS